ncbi:hypothetical protein AB5J72_23650 [Streptomyces sp. CG1]|uniref:hypothetical protein n=1 Tax=Streptomyces sp. CG1 TaxID=1287523 RepID=UPI0034E2CC91
MAFGLGVRGLVAAVRGGDVGRADAKARGGGTMAVTLLTVATGADNVSVYTPAFRSPDPRPPP